jgi:adsorption protein B
MVQLPVTPMEMPWHYWTSGTYLDEFGENHSKDLLVRERLT